MGFGENVAKMQKGTVDRISELPEFILHTILSNLDTKEACRASVLSKRWFDAWSSIPVLDFRPPYFQKYGEYPYAYGSDTGERFVEFINKTMERYFKRKYRITKMYLEIPKVHRKIETLVDRWIMIAVQNQIQILEIHDLGIFDYTLPEILFRAKSLKYLNCSSVGLPFYATMDLISLEYLNLMSETTLDEDMLERIISSCPLVVLDITYDNYLKKISIPWMKKVNVEVESRGSGTMQSNLQESPLQKFVYNGLSPSDEILWPWNINVAALKNLRKLEFDCVPITDDIVSELSYGLVVLESLIITDCFMLKCINISSSSLKQLRISVSGGLEKAIIDSPKLLEFFCCCEVVTSLSLVQALDHCNAQFCTLNLYSVTTGWLVKLKNFFVEANFFKSLAIELCSATEIEFEHDQLMNAGTAVPYKLGELKLCGTSSWTPTKSSLVAFLNGLFWCCHPDVLSLTTDLQDSTAKLILSILTEKVQHWKDPLKSIEIDGIEYPRVFSHSPELEIRIRLSW
ncbi:putative FBD-associated F-box protein At1g05080 [Silene latifolia]|uniref:putative FBD-associated F-box protein At1g05080 n=1 Tax=Silene latifolia TaxID=37657 RepID=UPI003D77801E